MRRTELVTRGQQFFSGNIPSDAADSLGLPGANTREADFGVNYFLKDGLKVVGSYGRQLSSAGNFNQWTVGIAYRFLISLGRGTPGRARNRCRSHARSGRTAIPRELRALPRGPAEVPAARHGHRAAPHASARHHYRRRYASGALLYDAVVERML